MELYDALKRFVEGIANKQQTYLCNVKPGSIDNENGTCIVTPLNGDADIVARFNVDVSNKTSFKPKENSIVAVQMFTSLEGVIIAFSEVESITLNGDSYNGLVIVTSLLNKINALENEINTLKTIFAAWVPVPADGGAALKALTTTFSTNQLVLTQQDEIENKTVKHGFGS